MSLSTHRYACPAHNGNRVRLFKFSQAVISTDFLSLLLLGLLFLSLRFRLFPFFYDKLSPLDYWMMAAMTTLGFALSVLAHEFAHLRVAKKLGGNTTSLFLYPFGATLRAETPISRAKDRSRIYSNGILANLSLAAGLYAIAYLSEQNFPGQIVTGILFHTASANLSLAVFHLLPALPLDGGRIWMGLTSRDTTTLFFHLGNFIGVLFLLAGGYQFFLQRPTLGAWVAMVGALLLKANFEEYRYLKRNKPEDLNDV